MRHNGLIYLVGIIFDNYGETKAKMTPYQLYEFGFFGPTTWIMTDEKKFTSEQYTFHDEHKTHDGKILPPQCLCSLKVGEQELTTTSWDLRILYPENESNFLRLQFNGQIYKVGFLGMNEIYLDNGIQRKVLKAV